MYFLPTNLRILSSHFPLFLSVQTITKINFGQGETFELKIKKIGRRGSRSVDNAEFGHFIPLLFC